MAVEVGHEAVLFQDQDGFPVPPGIQGGGHARRTPADHDDIKHLLLSSAKRRDGSLSSLPVRAFRPQPAVFMVWLFSMPLISETPLYFSTWSPSVTTRVGAWRMPYLLVSSTFSVASTFL